VEQVVVLAVAQRLTQAQEQQLELGGLEILHPQAQAKVVLVVVLPMQEVLEAVAVAVHLLLEVLEQALWVVLAVLVQLLLLQVHQ
jgi:hypothetical protein